MRSTSLANDPETKVPTFNFCSYQVGAVYSNNENQIDFITDGKSLYVCLVDNLRTSKQNIAEQEGLLKLVSQGETGPKGTKGDDGISGVTPVIGANFDGDHGKQLVITVNGVRKAVSPDLTGPSWKPVLEGNTLSWELTDDKYAPESIDLMKLRPVNDRPILLRTNSDNTKRSDEWSGPANFIQWKYEGDEYWTNLISISELMNLALAGVSFWEALDGKWHFGHREVVRASYSSDKNGRQIISNVDLGDVLFDAGEVPFPDNTLDIELLRQELEDLKAGLVKSVSVDGGTPNTPDPVTGNVDLPLNLDQFAKKSEIPEIPEQVDAYTKAQSDAKYQLKGNYLTEHQPIKTINGQSLIGNGNLDISGGSVDTSDCVKTLTIDGVLTRPENGNISFSLGNFNLFDLEVRLINNERHLVKIVNGAQTDLGILGSEGGAGCDKCWTAEEILAMINEEIAKIEEFDASGYYTSAEVDALIRNLQSQINALITDNPEIVAISFISTSIYTRTSDLTPPTVQTSFVGDNIALDSYGDVSEQALATKLQNAQSIWTTSPGNGNNYLWVSYARVKIPDGVFTSDWSTPSRLTGIPGRDGSDGGDIEFVYYRTTGEQPGVSNTGRYYDSTTETYSTDTTDASNDDFLPKVVLVDQTVNDYWQDHPEGISAQYTHEYVAIRTKKRNGTWGNFIVALWSRWGEDGIDGDGVQYIYTRTNDFPHTFSGVNDPTSWDTTSASYQSKYDEYYEGNWVDDPVGVSGDYPFEWVSLRKWRRVNGVYGWQPYSAPALWSTYAESSGTRTIITLDFNNSEEPVKVTEENKIAIGTDPIYLSTNSWSCLRTDTGELLDWGEIYIGKIVQGGIIFGENPEVTFVNGIPIFSNQINYDNDIERSITSASADEHKFYSFWLKVKFPANYVLSESYVVPIKVVDRTSAFVGIDYLKLNPVHSDKLVELNFINQRDVIKKASKEATIYDPSVLRAAGNLGNDTSFDTVSKFTYSYKFDDLGEITFENPTITSAAKRTILINKEVYFYYNSLGQLMQNSNNAFATLHIWNADDNQVEWDDWAAEMTINLNGSLIEDAVVLGIGYDGEITDRETSYVIYPGKDGVDGQKGDKGDTVQDAYFLTAVYDETNGAWATWFDNIRNGVSGYSWIPGELGQRWSVNIGTAIQTDTPVTLEQPTMTPTLKYLWKTSRSVTYSGNTPSYSTWSVPVLASQTGAKGETIISYQYLEGKVIRISDWTDEQLVFYDGDDLVDGVYYVDVVKYTSGNNTTYYKCKDSITYTANNKPASPATDTTHWEVYTPQADSFFDSLLANSAYIENLTSKQVVITDTVNNQTKIVAGMTSGSVAGTELDGTTTGDVRIWAGEMSTAGSLATAPFTVTSDGTLNATKANISNSATETINSVDYDEHVEISPNKFEITHENTANNVSAGIRMLPNSQNLGDRTVAALEVWQDTTGPALGVSGILKQRSGLFVNSVTNINANSQTFNIDSNLAIVTHNSGSTGSGLYSTAVIPFSANDSTSTTNGAHITFLRVNKGVCRIQPISGTIELVTGTNSTPVSYVEFAGGDVRVDVVRLENTIYAWKS